MCYHPWVGLDISPQGEFKPCCKFSKSLGNNLNEYQSNSELINLKKQFQQGIKPSECKRCWDDEYAGLPSKRQIDWDQLFNKTVPNLDKLYTLSFAFGNSCNLACRSCGSYASSGWIHESIQLKQHVPDLVIYDHQRFYQDKELLTNIKKLCSDIKYIEFPGGEPFLAGIAEHLSFLDWLILQGASNIKLHYDTNATIFPTDIFWDRWRYFKNVDIALSIDGIGEQFEYLRWPAKWDQVETNIKSYLAKRSIESNLKLSISHTVSIFNVLYLPEFTKWCLQNKFGKPYLGLVASPTIYSVKTFPKEVKQSISDKLNRFLFREIVSYMNNEDLNDKFDTTIKHIKLLDQQRDQSIENTFPELYQLLKDAKCQI